MFVCLSRDSYIVLPIIVTLYFSFHLSSSEEETCVEVLSSQTSLVWSVAATSPRRNCGPSLTLSLTSLASTPPPPPPPTNHPFQTKKVCIYLIKIKFWPLPTYQCIYHFLALACSVFFKVVLWLLNSPRSNFSIWIFVAQFSYFWCYLQWCLFKIKLTSIRIFLFLYCIIKHDDHNMYICESVKQKKNMYIQGLIYMKFSLY